jgi:hypothetical protein
MKTAILNRAANVNIGQRVTLDQLTTLEQTHPSQIVRRKALKAINRKTWKYGPGTTR